MAALRLGAKALATAGIAGAFVFPSVALADKDDGGKRDNASVKAMFDPEALERGATALREINKSPYAKQVRPLTSPVRRAWCKACTRRGRGQRELVGPALSATHPTQQQPAELPKVVKPVGVCWPAALGAQRHPNLCHHAGPGPQSRAGAHQAAGVQGA